MSDTDFSFEHRFQCEVLAELSGTHVPPRFFFPQDRLSGRDGVILRVEPEGAHSWIGVFAFGMFGKAGITKVLSMPDPDMLCVLARGAGYAVSASKPSNYTEVQLHPIIDARSVKEAHLVVLANYTEMLAYDERGIRWRTNRISWSDLKITAVSNAIISGEYWDIRDEVVKTFEVNLSSGAVTGGIEG